MTSQSQQVRCHQNQSIESGLPVVITQKPMKGNNIHALVIVFKLQLVNRMEICATE